MDCVAWPQQSRSGPPLALLGTEWLAAGWPDLRRPPLHDTAVATTGADVVGNLSDSVAGDRGVCPLSTATERKPIQRNSAAHLLFRYLYSLAFPCRAQRLLALGVAPLRQCLFHHLDSRQNYKHVSAYGRVNGRAPRNET